MPEYPHYDYKAPMAEKLRSVGRPIPRIDGRAKVTGSAQYVDDINEEGMLFGATLRSKIAHGKLISIRQSKSFDWQGITVATAEDVPGENYVALMEKDQPILVPIGGLIRHPDEAIALVAAPSAARAKEALEHLEVEVEELAAAFTLDDALSGDVNVGGENNILKSLGYSKGGDIDEAMAACDKIIEATYTTAAQEQMYIEPQGLVAQWKEGRVYIRGSMQCPYYIHAALQVALGLDKDVSDGSTQICVAQNTTGGGFGGKEEYPSMLACHAAILSKKTEAPVKIIYSRDEDIAATTKRHPSRIHHRLGIMADGTIGAIDVQADLNGGAYVTLSPVVLSRTILHAVGPYRCETLRVRGRVIATNTVPFGAYRGFGAPQATFAYERQMHKAALAVGMSQLEFRRKNMLRLGDITGTGQKLTYSVASEQVLGAVEKQLEQQPPTPSTSHSRHGAKLWRGHGLSFYYHGAGFTGSGEERLKGKAAVALIADGLFEVRSASTDIGQAVFTMFAQIASEALGLPVDAIRVHQPQTDMVPDSGPTVASRTCMVVGAVVHAAATELRDALLAYAQDEGLDSQDLRAIGRHYFEKHGELSKLSTYRSPPGIHFDEATYTGDAYPVYGWAACATDIVIDPDTYEVKIERMIHAVDVGKAINPVVVKGQIEGGTLQSIGWGLWENIVYDKGAVANTRMTTAIIPTSADAPELETIIIEEPYPHGPHGAKGVGEIPMNGPAVALANAVHDALANHADGGFDDPDLLPLLPEIIFGLVHGQETSEGDDNHSGDGHDPMHSPVSPV